MYASQYTRKYKITKLTYYSECILSVRQQLSLHILFFDIIRYVRCDQCIIF